MFSKILLGIGSYPYGHRDFSHQHKFIHDLLVDVGLENSKPLSFLVDTTVKLSSDDGFPIDDPTIYRKYIGKLLYLTVSRPDIAYIVNHLSQFLQLPRVPHFLAVRRVLRYLKGTPLQGLFFPTTSDLRLRAFCDSNWGNFHDSSRSITGFCLLLGDSLVNWQSKKQQDVSKSTVEAELRASADTACDLTCTTRKTRSYNCFSPLKGIYLAYL